MRRFCFSDSLYLTLGVHFALATFASIAYLVQPIVAALLHAFVAISYWGDSNRHFYLLRRLLPKVRSRNLLVTYPAAERIRRRIVITAHADAAPTGWMFRQWGLTPVDKTRRLGRPLLVALIGLIFTAIVDLVAATNLKVWFGVEILYLCITLYFSILATLNLQTWWGKQTVPGANDNLSGCVALPILAKRLRQRLDRDVELIVIVTGCEETGTGGAYELAKELRHEWNRENTDVIVLDCIGKGELCLFQEGEIIPWRIPERLKATAIEVAGEMTTSGNVRVFRLPAGSTDAIAFLAHGFAAIGIGRIDFHLKTPHNYHLPSDIPDNIDFVQLINTLDYVERLALRLGCDSTRV
ncbi:MAG TPA: M20/M25/M40 family metallo-hydrolase [Pirellulaceae bacterium]|nr:M20/M25/M40 family metallo-hydrolase [Pirellulaceae bacterium]HMO93884.1 M20/M25/M40 family metallo-hydrolase [Pirellulaceae bacterium]HMP70895.1 M20/M25/M40 family metallo-hydrolase [Pirellulaceae bacterium]